MTDAPDDGPREVIVPLRLYKTVAVFTTLIAVVLVVGGFIVIDAATARGTAPFDAVDPVVGLLGVGMLVAGGGIYAFATRFRTADMGADDQYEPIDADDTRDTERD